MNDDGSMQIVEIRAKCQKQPPTSLFSDRAFLTTKCESSTEEALFLLEGKERERVQYRERLPGTSKDLIPLLTVSCPKFNTLAIFH